MKKLLIMILGLLLLLISCSDDCEGENPSVQLVNNGTDKADIQIKTSGGNTENINNIESGTSSERREFAPGEIEFTINIQGVDDPLEYNLSVYQCYDYTVTINPDNTVSRAEQERE